MQDSGSKINEIYDKLYFKTIQCTIDDNHIRQKLISIRQIQKPILGCYKIKVIVGNNQGTVERLKILRVVTY